ncbi:MAG: hypothetical protein R2769_10715 [Saprospiraceae bacterium]
MQSAAESNMLRESYTDAPANKSEGGYLLSSSLQQKTNHLSFMTEEKPKGGGTS